MNKHAVIFFALTFLASCASNPSTITDQSIPSLILPSLNQKQNYLNQIVYGDEEVCLPLKSTAPLKKEQITKLIVNDTQEISTYTLETTRSLQHLHFPINCNISQISIILGETAYRYPVSIDYKPALALYQTNYTFKLNNFLIENDGKDKNTYRFDYQINLPETYTILGPELNQSKHPFQYAVASLYNKEEILKSNLSLVPDADYILQIEVTEDYYNYYFDGNIPFRIKTGNKTTYIKPTDTTIKVFSALSNQQFNK